MAQKSLSSNLSNDIMRHALLHLFQDLSPKSCALRSTTQFWKGTLFTGSSTATSLPLFNVFQRNTWLVLRLRIWGVPEEAHGGVLLGTHLQTVAQGPKEPE